MIDPERLAEVKAMLRPQADLAASLKDSRAPAEQTELPLVVSVPFHGDKITAIAVDGEYMVPVKPIAERLGLDWSSQLQRIKRDYILNEGVVRLTTPSNGGLQESVCLPMKYIPGWLFGVDEAQVAPDIQEAIRTYKREMYDVMYAYLVNGEVLNPRFQAKTPKHVDSCTGLKEYGTGMMDRMAISVVCEAADRIEDDTQRIAFLSRTMAILSDIYPSECDMRETKRTGYPSLLPDRATDHDKVTLIQLVVGTGQPIDIIRLTGLCRLDERKAGNVLRAIRKAQKPMLFRVQAERFTWTTDPEKLQLPYLAIPVRCNPCKVMLPTMALP